MLKKLILLLLFCTAGFLLPAIETGKGMPAIRISKWYTSPASGMNDPLECIVLFDATAADAVNMLRMLESLQDEFQIPFKAVAVNGDRIAKPVITAAAPFSIGIAADSKMQTRNSLAENESLFPYAVLAREGVVQWTGHPTELENVIAHIRSGKFSISRQRKIEAMRKELQMAIQSGLPLVVLSNADKILALNSSDRIAIQAKIVALNSMRRSAEIPDFIQKVCKENPQDLRLRILQMDLLLQQGNAEGFRLAVEDFNKDFSKPTAGLVTPVAYIIENAPYGFLSPAFSKQLAQRAYDGILVKGKLPDKKGTIHAVACETLARVYAQNGNFAEAVKLQRTALAIRKGSRQEKAALQRLNYFISLQKYNTKSK